MSYTVDNRAVHMEFDNAQFERNVKTTMNSLDKFKEKLNLKGATKGLEDIDKAAGKVNMAPMGSALEQVSTKFSALQIIGTTALANITNSAVNAGKQLIKSLSMDQISAGWEKYGQKTSAVGTLISQGYDISTVDKQLKRLNWFTDETSYNFTDMVENIAKFTATGQKLEPTVTAIEGIALWAAMSGQNATKASHAMYQLSQAMGSGYMRKEDYKSIQNVSMDTDSFRQKCLDAAVALGTLQEVADGTYKSLNGKGDSFTKSQFADHLTEDAWFTSDVMMKVFNEYSSAVDQIYEYAEKHGVTASEAIEALGDTIDTFALSAFKAGQEARTFRDVIDSVKDAVSTGWMNIFENVIGNYEEATVFYTDMANSLYDVFAEPLNSVNEVLEEGLGSGWKKFLDAGIGNSTEYIDELRQIASKTSDAFEKIYSENPKNFNAVLREGLESGAISADTFTEAIDNLLVKMEAAKQSESTLQPINIDEFMQRSNTEIKDFQREMGILVDGIISPETLGALDAYNKKINDNVCEYTDAEIESLQKLKEELANGTLSMEEFTESMTKMSGRENLLQAFWNTWDNVVTILSSVKEAFRDIFPPVTAERLYDFTEKLKNLTEIFRISDENLDKLKRTFKGLFSILDVGKKALSFVFKPIKNFITGGALSSLTGGLLDITASFGDFFTKLNEGLSLDESLDSLSGVVKKISTIIGNAFKSIGGGIGNVLSWITKNFSFSSVLKGLIGGGIFALVQKCGKLVDNVKGIFDKIKLNKESGKSSFKEIFGSLKEGLQELQTGVKTTSILKIAVAVALLANAINKLSALSPADIAVAVGAIGALMGELIASFTGAMAIIKKLGTKGINKAAFSMILMAAAVKILADAVSKMADLSWSELVRGLTACAVGLLELVAAVKLLGSTKLLGETKISLKTILAVIVIANVCKTLAKALKEFATLSWGEIGRGLTAMGAALAELVAAVSILGNSNLSGGKALAGSLAMLIATMALDDIAAFMERISARSWADIAKGLVAMGAALAELGGISAATGYFVGIAGLYGAGTIALASTALDDIANALIKFGSMSWSEVGTGLTAMGGALAEVAGISGAAGYLTGLSGLVGAGTIALGATALDDIANALIKFGSMSWGDIGTGLVAMGGALAEVAAISGATGCLTGLAGLAGAGTIALASTALDDIANALIKFGSMSWEDIGTGLTAMSGAMASISIGSLANTFSGFGADAIATVSAPLGDLADSVKKWEGVTVPDGIGDSLSDLSTGIKAFTLAGFGSNAVSDVAEPLGTMADSIQKWKDTAIPSDIETGLSNLSKGIKSFTFSGWGADSLSEIVTPIGTMADSVKKWEGVTVPDNIESGLVSLAAGVKAFTLKGAGASVISEVAEPIGTLADSVKKWNSINISDSVSTNLSAVASTLESFSDIYIDIDTLTSATSIITSFSESVSALSGSMGDGSLSGQIISLFDSVSSASSEGTLNIVSSITNALSESGASFSESGTELINSLISAIKFKGSSLSTAIRQIMQSAATAISNSRQSFYNSGVYAGQGGVQGLLAMAGEFYNAGAQLANQANAGYRNNLQIRSPSRVMFQNGVYTGQGAVNGIMSMVRAVFKAGEELGNATNTGFNNTVNSISERINGKINDKPVITPILDLSNVEDGASRLSSMFNGRTISSAYKADGIAASLNEVRVSGNSKNASPTVYNNFTQNNYSPKALSRAEIYRQTKSQFSAMERMARA